MVKSLRLADRAGEAIERPRAVNGGEPLADDLDGDLIWDKQAALEVFSGFKAGGCAGGFLVAQHRADGRSLNTEAGGQQVCLSALPGSGRSEQHYATMHGTGLPQMGGEEEA